MGWIWWAFTWRLPPKAFKEPIMRAHSPSGTFGPFSGSAKNVRTSIKPVPSFNARVAVVACSVMFVTWPMKDI